MIQVNLLRARPSGRRVAHPWIEPAQRPAAAGLILLMLTAAGIAGWWWKLDRDAHKLDASISTAQADLTRLHAAAQLVDRASARKAELTERLSLIDRLHRVKRDPVELLSAVSRAVPDGLWLIEVKQMSGSTVQIEGRALSLTALTDFVESLQTSGRFERPVDIVTTNMEPMADQNVVRFAVRGKTLLPGAIAAPASAPAHASAAPAGKH